MENLYIIILPVLFTAIIGMMGYWLKNAHREFKQLLRELTDYTGKLKELIVGIRTQIDKSIETDIQDIKADIKNLYVRDQQNNIQISKLNQKVAKK